jgi:outer membrane protein OmpA-like peptidoglycan-associated protein/tetratricopeptide (TPR) repeat protein
MKNRFNNYIYLFFFAAFLGNAQDSKLKKANTHFENFEYVKAIDQYERQVKKGNTSPELYRNLADANYLNANYEQASKWYELLAASEDNALDAEHTYRYAHSLRSIQKYQKSDQVMKQLSTLKQNDLRVAALNNSKDYLKTIEEQSGKFTIKNIAINSSASDFAPSFRENGIVFSTGRDTSGLSKNVHNWNKKRFLNLYTAILNEKGSLQNPQKFSQKINTKVHESSTVFTKDGKTVYFTRNNEKSGNFSRDKEGVSRLKIYRAQFHNNEWSKIEALPFNSDSYSVAHPALNKDENKLYFSSDMPGTYGMSDIFVVAIHTDGTFGIPKNIGNKINTESKESFPFVTDEDVLYFASDGHPGLGGMDIFATDLKELNIGKIVNIGEPINSSSDDFSFIIDSKTKKGYFASNRIDGKGDDDIYALEQIEDLDLKCHNVISGILKDSETGMTVANALVALLNDQNQELHSTISKADGSFNIDTDCANGDYHLIATKDDYQKSEASLTKKGSEAISSVELLLVKIDTGAPIGTDLANYLNIEPIYFDFNKWNIRPDAEVSIQKIIDYLNLYPQANVNIGSHTDSRASKAYNVQLSNKRAKSTMEYLIDKGISSNRLSALGFGETSLLNDCIDDTLCTKEKHQQNRRSEFILVE